MMHTGIDSALVLHENDFVYTVVKQYTSLLYFPLYPPKATKCFSPSITAEQTLSPCILNDN